MEVHHHPHVEKKRFKEYILEFLMIFFAVFLGFIAENIRENIVEKEKGKQYIQSFYEDLKTDTVRLNYLIDFEAKKIAALNVLVPCYDSLLKGQTPVSLLGIVKHSLSNNPFQMNGRTFGQLTNGGGFRLLPKTAADSIISYQKQGNNIEEYQSTLYQQSQDNLRNTFNEIVDFIPYSKLYSNVGEIPIPDATGINQPLILCSDKVLLRKYFNQLFQYLRVIVQHRNGLKRLRDKANILLSYFKYDYHLE
ncbi:MAG TPA: hypothetical protein VK588_13625 [Chitinophagaceae bacterium]|nr:hypothetical protein [Chitinophagaceae bacterium]